MSTSKIDFKLSPFEPPRWLRGAHAQTIVTNLMRREGGIPFKRERIDTPDGDFIDLDYPQISWAQLTDRDPIVIHLHGLEGNARRGYACEAYRQLAMWGIRAVGMNYRSCSGEINRTPRFYHAGATDDIRLVYDHLEQKFPGVAKGMMGVSLGGNMLLKLLGEWGTAAPQSLKAAVAISPPFDMVASSRKFLKFPGTFYGRRFLRYLNRKVLAKREMLEPLIDVERVLESKTLVDFDEYGTAPLGGFAGAEDYYRRNGSGQFLPQIARPTLILRSQDDPLMDPADIPYELTRDHPYLRGMFPKFGGHVGFLNGKGMDRYWAEGQAARYLHTHFAVRH